MATARGLLKEALEPLGWPIVLSRIPKDIGQTTLVIANVRVDPTGTGRMRTWELSVYLLTPKAEPERADDELDAALDQLLDQLDKASQLVGTNWTEAVRGTTEESFNSYRLVVKIILQEAP